MSTNVLRQNSLLDFVYHVLKIYVTEIRCMFHTALEELLIFSYEHYSILSIVHLKKKLFLGRDF